jgi:hypothetical protein
MEKIQNTESAFGFVQESNCTLQIKSRGGNYNE